MSIQDAFGNPWEIAKAGWVAVAAVVTWIGRDHIKQDRHIAEKQEKRIACLEHDMTEKFSALTDEMTANHKEILTILIDRLPPKA